MYDCPISPILEILGYGFRRCYVKTLAQPRFFKGIYDVMSWLETL